MRRILEAFHAMLRRAESMTAGDWAKVTLLCILIVWLITVWVMAGMLFSPPTMRP